MRKLTVLVLSLIPALALAQPEANTVPLCTAANLPTCIGGVDPGRTAYILDGANSTDCSVGGGTSEHICTLKSDGTFTAAGSGGGGIAEVADDPSPTLGGPLDADGNSISNVDDLEAASITLSTATDVGAWIDFPEEPDLTGAEMVQYGVNSGVDLTATWDCRVDAGGAMPQRCVTLDGGITFHDLVGGGETIQYGLAAGVNLAASLDCRVGTDGKIPIECLETAAGGGDVVWDTGSTAPSAPTGTLPEARFVTMPFFSDATGKLISSFPEFMFRIQSGVAAAAPLGSANIFREAAVNGNGLTFLGAAAATPAFITQTLAIVDGRVPVITATGGIVYEAVTVATTMDSGDDLCLAQGLSCVANTTAAATNPGAGQPIVWIMLACGTGTTASDMLIRAACNNP